MQSFESLLIYCQLLLQIIQTPMENVFPKMINIERDQRHLNIYKSSLFEVI